MNKILIVGCGDIAMRVARLLHTRYTLFGLVRNPARFNTLREANITPLLGDLDNFHSLKRIAGLADTVFHFAPPAQPSTPSKNVEATDTRTRNLLAALSHAKRPNKLVYISTSGVYGDCKGAIVTETHPLNASNQRAKLRVDAERRIRTWSKQSSVSSSILRVPGIYAADRLPVERLKKGTPAIISTEDSFTNHIHADDLARAVVAAFLKGKPNRVYHTVDDSQLKMGDYFDVVADAFHLPHPKRISRIEAQEVLSPMLLSFMNESRRLSNSRLKTELKLKLNYPTVGHTLATL